MEVNLKYGVMGTMVLEKAACFCEGLDFDTLPAEVTAMAKKCFLDYLGSALAGQKTRAGRIGAGAKQWLGGAGNCTIIGYGAEASPLAAAFANGTLSSALDYDDGHRGAVGHAGAMVFTTALAAAGANAPVTGREFISAVVAGYETAVRCGMVMNSCHEKRFYGSGGWAVFGAAAAAARLLGLKGEQLKNAVAVCEVYGPTAQCTKSIAYGAMSKESIGWGAATALFSALLARDGFTGPGEILLDNQFYRAGAKDVFQSLGLVYEIENTYFKQFASCRWSHSPISAALILRKKHQPDISQIKKVRVETFAKALTLNHKSPVTTEAAQYSIPYTLAAALKHGMMGPGQVAEEALGDPEVLALAARVELSHAPDLESLFPAKRPARVILGLAGGEELSAEVHLVPGDPEFPLDYESLADKFRPSALPVLGEQACEQVIDTVTGLERLTEITEVTRLLYRR